MRIIDSIADWLIYTPAMEQAQARKEARTKVLDLGEDIAHHLVKVLIMSDSIDVPRWKAELNDWLESVNRLKVEWSKKRLPSAVLFRLLHDCPFDEGLSSLLHDYNITPTIAQQEQLLNRIRPIMVAICTDLSQGKFTTIDDYLNA